MRQSDYRITLRPTTYLSKHYSHTTVSKPYFGVCGSLYSRSYQGYRVGGKPRWRSISSNDLRPNRFALWRFVFSGFACCAVLQTVANNELATYCHGELFVRANLFVPIWYFFLPSGLNDISQSQLLIQTLYQGLIPGLVGLLLVAFATRNIGPSSTAAIMAAVPALGSVLGVLLLDEMLGGLGWMSLAVLTPGILLVAYYSGK